MRLYGFSFVMEIYESIRKHMVQNSWFTYAYQFIELCIMDFYAPLTGIIPEVTATLLELIFYSMFKLGFLCFNEVSAVDQNNI